MRDDVTKWFKHFLRIATGRGTKTERYRQNTKYLETYLRVNTNVRRKAETYEQ